MEKNFKALFFDLGNVVIDFDHMIAVNKIVRFSKLAKEEIFDVVFDSNLTALFEEGKISEQKFFLELKDLLKIGVSYKDFLPIWNEIFFITPRNRYIQRMIRSFSGKFSLFLISNVNKLHFVYLKSRFDIFRIFNKLILSYEVGVRKPSPIIYQKALEIAECRPQETLYFDDRKDLVEAAEKLGINSFQFTGIDSFKEALSNLIKI